MLNTINNQPIYFYTTSQFNHVNAINAETGEEIWEFNPLSYLQGSAVNHGWIHRGLAYWEKDEDKRILVGTLDGYLYSLDACTGKEDIQFGSGGRINLKEGLGRAINDARFFGVNAPPLVTVTIPIDPVVAIPTVTAIPVPPPPWKEMDGGVV